MIPNQWYPILLPEDIRNDRPTSTKRMGENLVLWRDVEGNLVCQAARCPHKGADLGDGRMRGNSVECRYHGFRYGPDGSCVGIPALGSDARIPASLRVKTYPVREHVGLIWLWWGDDRTDLPEILVPPEIENDQKLYATKRWTRPVHYTRYIESVLEFYHVTTVHRDHWFNWVDYMFLYGTPRKLGLDGMDRYLAARKVENSHLEVDGLTLRYSFDHCDEEDRTNTNHYEVTFAFPSMSHIVNDQFSVTAWFAPIDDENTEIFVRWYEFPRLKPLLRAKKLRSLLPKLSVYMEKWVQDPQDVRIMLRQEPKVAGKGASKFIAVDELNATYVSIRARLIAEAEAAAKAGKSQKEPPARRVAASARRQRAAQAGAGVPADNGSHQTNGSRAQELTRPRQP
jgi:phenylpropionate dioxygenase-like ring-hydroxylating dioxygenase large terminal subunit